MKTDDEEREEGLENILGRIAYALERGIERVHVPGYDCDDCGCTLTEVSRTKNGVAMILCPVCAKTTYYCDSCQITFDSIFEAESHKCREMKRV